MEIKINDYYEPDHFRALNEDNYNLSHSCEYDKNEMHHIHEACEILMIENGSAAYYIDGKKYDVEPGDILIIGSRQHHMRRLERLPFLRYGLALKPSYYRSLNLGEDLLKVFQTPSPEDFKLHFKSVPPAVFDEIIRLIQFLYSESGADKPFSPLLERSILTEIAVILYRQAGLKQKGDSVSSMHERMVELKEYIDGHYWEPLDLNVLGKQFFLHPVTISKEFKKSFGYTLTKYINNVRICESAKRLETTRDSVLEIASACGYESVNTFLRHFKAVMETTPLQYRKAMQEWFSRNSSQNEPLRH